MHELICVYACMRVCMHACRYVCMHHRHVPAGMYVCESGSSVVCMGVWIFGSMYASLDPWCNIRDGVPVRMSGSESHVACEF